MLKKVAFVGLGAVLLVTLAFGSRLPSYASTMYKSVQAKVDDSVSLQFKLEDARNQLDKLGPEVNQMKYEFVRQESVIFCVNNLNTSWNLPPWGRYANEVMNEQ